MVLTVVSVHIILSQEFSPNVKVNHETTGESNLWGGNALALFEENIYVLWTEGGKINDTPYSYTYLSKSTDGGETFDTGVPVSTAGNQIFGALTVGQAASLYVTWTGIDTAIGMPNGIYFSRSTDEGITFDPHVTISPSGAMPVIASYGDFIYIFFLDRKDNDQFGFFLARSTDGGNSFELPYEVTDAPVTRARFEDMNDIFVDQNGTIYCVWNDGRRDEYGSDIYFAKSTDNGVSFGANMRVNDISGPNDRDRFGSTLVVYGPTVYVAWREEDGYGNRKIAFTRSDDGGLSFNQDKLFSETGWGSPVLAINNDGELYLAYPDYQPSPPNQVHREGIFCAVSIDQGDSFPAVRIISDQNTLGRNPSLHVDTSDILYAVWTDDRAGKRDVYFSKGAFPLKGPAAPFSLLEPADGSLIIFSAPDDSFSMVWEDVLELDNSENIDDDDPPVYYLFQAALDPDLQMTLGYDYFIQPYEEIRGGEIGFVFGLLKHLTDEEPGTVDIYWTIAAVNDWGTTWAIDTFQVSFEIDNAPPLEGFQLLEPGNNATVEVLLHGDTFIPTDGNITLTWNPTTDPDGDTVVYYWLMSDVFPLPGIYEMIFGDDNGDNNGPHIFMLPSGEFDADWNWENGGSETYITIPYEIAYYWFLGGYQQEKTFYWTIIASDGFNVFHWVPAADTLQITFTTVTTQINELDPGLPTEFHLDQNYPNPFNPTTTIRFSLPSASNVRLDIYNLLGQRIATLIDDDHLSAGRYEIMWDGRDASGREVSSGIYIYSITAGKQVSHKRMIMLK
jgi:hypothetical protein